MTINIEKIVRQLVMQYYEKYKKKGESYDQWMKKMVFVEGNNSDDEAFNPEDFGWKCNEKYSWTKEANRKYFSIYKKKSEYGEPTGGWVVLSDGYPVFRGRLDNLQDAKTVFRCIGIVEEPGI